MIDNLNLQAAYRGLKLFMIYALFLISNTVFAAGFSVSPISVQISNDKRVATLQIRNSSNSPISIQSEVMKWSQVSGKDQLEPSRELLVTPPIFKVDPGAVQIIRLGLRTEPKADMERAFRLFVTEIPSADSTARNGLNIITRLSLPVFVAPAKKPANSNVKWQRLRHAEGSVNLNANNTGTAHAKITKFSLSVPGQEPITQTGNFYILPGAAREWSIPTAQLSANPGDEVELSATVNGEQISTRLVLE